MIVEIHGVDSERMDIIERMLVSRFAFTKADGFDKKICINADTGEATLQNAHRDVFESKNKRVRVYLREPGELCVVIDGSKGWIVFLLQMFDVFSVSSFKLLMQKE